MKLSAWMMVCALALPGVAAAQEEVLTSEPGRSGAAEEWRPFARSQTYVYLAELGTPQAVDGVTTVRMARVPRAPSSPDSRRHAVEIYQVRCGDGQVRGMRFEEYGDDGALEDGYDEQGEWEAVLPASNLAFIKTLVCEGARPEGRPWPSLPAFLASPRT